jgi:hypothetical protein
MIPQNELRVNNWVYDTDIPGNSQLKTGFDIAFHERFEPIPLTPELLEKAGFKKGEYTFAKMDFTLNYNSDLGDYRYRRQDGGATSIIHLHQLQNLYFALTGEELEITL